jgi:hypothetical protein
MELSPCWVAASRSDTQEFLNILWNPKVHYRVHKSPLLVRMRSQLNSVHTTQAYFSLKSILMLFFHLRLGASSGLFPYGFPIKALYTFIFSPYVLHVLRISSLFIVLIAFGKEYKTWRTSLCNFLETSYYFNPHRSKYAPQHPFLKHPQSVFLP